MMRKIAFPAASALSVFFALTALTAIGMLSAPAQSHAASRLVHLPSNMCVHPVERKYKDGTRLALHADDCFNQAAHVLNFHYDGENGRIVHTQTGQCVEPESRQVRPRPDDHIVLGRCNSDAAEFLIERGQYLRHIGGLCVQIDPGKRSNQVHAHNDVSLVLRDGCRGERLAFRWHDFNERTVDRPETKLMHRFSGMCAKPEGFRTGNNTTIVLTTHDCNREIERMVFQMMPNGAIRHLSTGKCIHPHLGKLTPRNNRRLVLHDGCDRMAVRWRQLESGVIQHQFSGKCIHPSGGSEVPREGTGLVIHDGCYGKRLEMEFVDENYW